MAWLSLSALVRFGLRDIVCLWPVFLFPVLLGFEMWACYCSTQFLASLFLRYAVPVTTGFFWMIATSDELLTIHLGLVDLSVILT